MAMTHDERIHRHRSDRREYLFYYVATYPVFLLIATLSRLLPRAWRPFASGGRSVFGDARAAAHTVLPCVFMG